MANTINIPKAHLIMALCLPLAVLLGYFVANPLESGSLAVVILVLFVLAVPLLMKWHHPLVLLCWNSGISFYFLPGQPSLWLLIAFASLLFAVLNRSVSEGHRFVYVPSVTISLLFLLAVVLATAILTGGVGLRTLGSKTYGGRKLLFLIASMVGYFALTCQRISAKRAGLYVALYLLPGLLSLLSILAFQAGSGFYFLYDFFSPEGVGAATGAGFSFAPSIVRYSAFIPASTAVVFYLLARHGVLGILDVTKPWRMLLVLAALIGCLFGGFRSAFIIMILTMLAVFCLEGLWRTRWLPIFATAILAAGVVVLPQMYKLPPAVQRTLSFLPGQISPMVRADADDTLGWRVEVWKQAWPDVKRYWLAGKGYALDANDLYMSLQASRADSYQQWALVTELYHNGPLSVIIPFGIFGVIAVAAFLGTGVRYLYCQYRYGDPTLKRINTFLLSALVVRIALFSTIAGGLEADLFTFVGLIGLGVSLNGETATAPAPAEEESEAMEPAEADLAV
jgi:O-antigen ligase